MASIGLRSLRVGKTFPRFIPNRRQYSNPASKNAGSPNTSGRLLQFGSHKLPNHILKVSRPVRAALKGGRPVVALETTIYTHGFPYPANVALASDLEAIVEENGGVPATIGVLDGVAMVGMKPDELKRLASSAGRPETMKVSRRDLPYILGMGMAGRPISGGTTISGTMFLAHQAGIKVFGTGGLGGVHRGGENSMDISADLTELGRTPVAVISSGCKSFLDLPRTLEYLETQGVGVFAFADGRTGAIDFPSFYTRDSGVRAPMVVQTAKEAAAIIYSQSLFPHSSGLHFGNPIPEEFSIPKDEIDTAINQAVQEAADQGIHGHANTPFILARIKELTEGRSIPANRALIESNVRMATKVAVELAALSQGGDKSIYINHSSSESKRPESLEAEPSQISMSPAAHTDLLSNSNHNSEDINVLVFGGVAVDLSCDFSPPQIKNPQNAVVATSPQMHTSNIASIGTSVGGVGHNVALAIHRAGGSEASVRLHTFIGDDLAGKTILSLMEEEGLDINGVIKLSPSRPNDPESSRTAQYVAVNDKNKDLVLAMADMEIFNNSTINQHLSKLPEYPDLKWVVVDANLHSSIATKLLHKYSTLSIKTAFEPVSAAKSASIFTTTSSSPPLGIYPNHTIDLATPNTHELAAMHASAKENSYFDSPEWWSVIDSLGIPSSGARDRFLSLTTKKLTDEGIPLRTIQLLPLIPTILTKLGADGVLLTTLLPPNDERLTDPRHARYILSRNTNGSKEVGGVYMRLFGAVEEVRDVVSVNGVGDTFLGVLVAGLMGGGEVGEELIGLAQRGAVMSLRSREAVSPLVGGLSGELGRLGGGGL